MSQVVCSASISSTACCGNGGPLPETGPAIVPICRAPRKVSERRWKLSCDTCGQIRYKDVYTLRVRLAKCHGKRYTVIRNPQHVPRPRRKPRRRQPRNVFTEGEDGYVSGCPPEFYDEKGRFLSWMSDSFP